MGWNGAELDDLVQEGLISVWWALQRDRTPSQRIIEFQMRKWVRTLGGQMPADYVDIVSLDQLLDTADEPAED